MSGGLKYSDMVLAEVAERCRDNPMEMAKLLKQAAELLRSGCGEIGTTVVHINSSDYWEWQKRRDQWMKDAGFDK
jgi:hypothetical protein